MCDLSQVFSEKPATIPIIDVDVHPIIDYDRVFDFLAEPWRSRYASGNRSAGGLGYWNPNGVMRSDAVLDDGTPTYIRPETLAAHHFDTNNLAYGVLNNPHIGMPLSPEPDYAASVISAFNDILIEDWLPVDERFLASIMVPLGDPQLAVREIHRVGDHPRVAQVLLPGGSPLLYGNRYFHPLYQAAAAHDLPVTLHPGPEGTGISGRPTAAGYPSSYLEWHTGLSTVYQSQLLSLVTEGVFQKFPTLKVVLLEAGVMWLPPLMWRLDKNWKALRMTSPWLDRPPSDVIQDHVMLNTQPIEEPEKVAHFRAMLDMFDAESMLMFSSDYPHWDGDTPDFAARMFPESMRKLVLAENARDLYRLAKRQ